MVPVAEERDGDDEDGETQEGHDGGLECSTPVVVVVVVVVEVVGSLTVAFLSVEADPSRNKIRRVNKIRRDKKLHFRV